MPARPVGGKTCLLLYRVAEKKATAHCASIRRMQQAATSCGVKLTREYVQYLKDEIGRLRHENEVKNAHLKKLREKK